MPTRWGRITTIAGAGTPGYAGDGGAAKNALLNNPFYCAFDKNGNLFIAESGNNAVRRIDARTGRISTVAGANPKGFAGDNGPAVSAAFNDLVSVAVEPKTGDLYVADRLNQRVRKIDGKTGIVSTVAGSDTKGYGGDNGPGSRAALREPHDLALDGRGGLLIADVADCRVRRLDLKTGIITTFAGTGKKAHEGDNGPKESADLWGARALAVNPRTDDVFVCEREGNCVRKIEAKTGRISTVAGVPGQKGYGGDNGLALFATLNGPKSLCLDAQGNLFIVDTENHAVRVVDAKTGVIFTVAGGRKGPDGDNEQADKAGLNRPHGAVISADGSLVIADSENHRVRRVTPG